MPKKNRDIFVGHPVYFFVLKTSLFRYIVLFKNDDIFKKFNMQKFYRKMFNKNEIRDRKTFELKLYELFLKQFN